MKRFLPQTLALVAAIAAVGSAQAVNYQGRTSDPGDTTGKEGKNVRVGKSTVNGGPHQPGKAGIAARTMGLEDNKYVNFSGLTSYSAPYSTADNVKVYQLSNPSSAPGTHDGMGVFSFAQVGSQDLWFGEWLETAAPGYADRTVYYVGDKDTYTAGAGTNVKYAVKGINKFTGSNLMAGDFTANFSTKKLTGELTGGFKLNIGTANISNSGGISGTGATAKTPSGTTLANGGAVSGQFFGANAAALAGIANFADNNYDTAFGGNKK